MEYYESLNAIVEKIEKSLTEKIDYKELAKIAGTSEYTLQKIFCFLTGITLTDYIRKRRLSKATEEIQITNNKIIDIAIKYQYNSSVIFSRAFLKMNGVLPSVARKEKCRLKVFPKIIFESNNQNVEPLDFRVIDKEAQVFYGKATKIIDEKDKKSIKELWDICEEDGSLEYIKKGTLTEEKYYGAVEYIDLDKEALTIKYYILGKKKRQDFEKITIPKAKWVIFKLNSKEQKDILELINTIYTKWLPSSEYNIILPYPNLEIYYENYCEYCVAVK